MEWELHQSAQGLGTLVVVVSFLRARQHSAAMPQNVMLSSRGMGMQRYESICIH